MLRITFISQRGERTTVEAAPGQTVLEVAHAHEIGLPGTCGASKICATCHVKIAADYRSKKTPWIWPSASPRIRGSVAK